MEAEKFARTTLLKAGKNGKAEIETLGLLCKMRVIISLSEGRHISQGLSSLARGHAGSEFQKILEVVHLV